MTRDVHRTGAYIDASELPPVGALVQLDIVLPNPADNSPKVHLIGEGMVLRVEPDRSTPSGPSRGGFAVSVQFYVESSESVVSHLRGSERAM